MYNYPHYKETDPQKVLEFMKQHPFVTIIGASASGRLEATQVPVLVGEKDGQIVISGHIACKTDHEKAFSENPEVLVIFTGAHTYVSGTYYTGNLQQASTWNYISIHARGRLRWMNEEDLRQMLKALTLHFENGNTSSTTIYDNLPSHYIDKLVKGIMGFEMVVTELDNVHKLSQNRDEVSYDNIVAQLKKGGGDAREIGELMEERKNKVFPS